MEGRDFAPPAHLLAERGALVHRTASRIAPTGHSSVQHTGHFQPGKYYPPHIPMPPQSASGLMGSSSPSFMGTFLTSSLGTPPSHSSGPPTSPPSPSFRGGPHSSASQIWFSHSHEAPGYPRFSGSLAPTFLPMSPLDHHGNSSVLYGQHRFYDTQKDFYLRGLPSQTHLLSANHSLPPLSRTAPGHPLGACSRERDPGGGTAPHKSSKETAERGVAPGGKEKERSKAEAKESRQGHGPLPTAPHLHPHPHQYQPHHPHHEPPALAEDPRHPSDRHKDEFSACRLGAKLSSGDLGAGGRGSLPSCAGPRPLSSGPLGAGSRCCKESASGEMRISEAPSDCLRHSSMLGPHAHAVPYPIPPPPLAMGSAVGGSWLHHHHHQHPHHPDLYCPPPPPPAPLAMPSAHDKGLAHGVGREPRVTGPTFVPSVGPLGDKMSGPFQLGNPHCRSLGGGIVNGGGGSGQGKGAKTQEKSSSSSSSGSSGGRAAPPLPSSCQRRPPHVYGKADKAPDWPPGAPAHLHQHLQQSQPLSHPPAQPNSSSRSFSLEATESSGDMDACRPSLPQGAKAAHHTKSGPYASTPPFRDCSHSGPPHRTPADGQAAGEVGCTPHSQRVARIRHQQHGNRPGSDGPGSEPAPSNGGRLSGAMPVWSPREQQHHPHADGEPRAAYDPFSHRTRPSTQGPGEQPGPKDAASPQGPNDGSSAMKSLLKYSSSPQPLLLSQRGPFGGLGCLKQGPAGGSDRERLERNGACALQEGKQTLPPRRASSSGESDRSERGGREAGETHGEGEVRQPPVGIAVAVARQREPPCRPSDAHHSNSRHGRVPLSMKGVGRSVFPLDGEVMEERKRACEEQLALPPLDRERELLLRENKERVEFARIHPSSSCHGDLTSHLIMPGGSQLGADPSAHAHPAHHHWMSQAGSPSLWIPGHSYGLSHAALHQNLAPGFSAAMPSPLQPVLPLPQDPSTALVVLPTEPAAHPATHHLDVMEQSGLWPPVYGARGPTSHMQHPAVYTRSQFLRQQELYALQQHQQQQQHRAAQAMELAHRHSHAQRKPEDPPIDLENPPSGRRTPKPTKPYSLSQSSKTPSSPGGCAARLSPCCRSPALHPHPVAAPRSPALSPPAPPHLPKAAESQDKRGEGQPPHDYPQSLEPDLPPEYTYPAIAMGYKGGPSPQEVQLAEHADLEAEQAEPAPQILPLSSLEEEPGCPEAEPLLRTAEDVEEMEAAVAETGREVEEGLTGVISSASTAQASFSSSSPSSSALTTCASPRPAVDPAVTKSQHDTADAASHERINLSQDAAAAQEDEESAEGLAEEPSSTQALTSDPSTEEDCGRGEEECALPGDGPVPLPPASPPPAGTVGTRYPGSCIWSLELLIAAALCATRDARSPVPTAAAPVCGVPPHRGMELLSELAELERQHQEQSSSSKDNGGDELLTFDLRSLATLAAARALELSSAAVDSPPPLRRTLNLRRKSKWTPRNEPVCPVKVAMETLEREELAMRVRLGELQRRYKEKQRELAKLQRKHDHQREETSRSPARRGPGRPRKRKSTSGPAISLDTPKKIKSAGAGPGQPAAEEEAAGGGDGQRKRKRMTNSAYHHLSASQMKARCKRGRPSLLSSKMAQLKQKAQTQRGSRLASLLCHRKNPASKPMQPRGEHTLNNTLSHDAGAHSDTGSAETGAHQSRDGQRLKMRRGRRAKVVLGRAAGHHQTRATQVLHKPGARREREEVEEEVQGKDTSPTDSEVSEPEEDDDGMYDSEEGLEGVKNVSAKEQLPAPSPSAILRVDATQRAKNKRDRQRSDPVDVNATLGREVRRRKRAPCRPPMVSADRSLLQEEVTKLRVPRWGEAFQEGRNDDPRGLKSPPSPGEKPKASRNSTLLRAPLGKRRSCWLESVPSRGDLHAGPWSRRSRRKQAKGHAVSRLLESFTADEGFHMDDDSSFSEEEEGEDQPHRRALPGLPDCVLTKEALVDGLKVLISKEDELLYAAYVHTLDPPDIYSIVIEGERGNRPRIYTLEQLLQEAVLEMRPESEAVLTTGTRVCAYWSERSRCLYPGYVHRGEPGGEQKEGSVMVEFDDGDRGWISLSNIRLLPPDYQIFCAEPSPALLVSAPQKRRQRSSVQESSIQKANSSLEQPDHTEPGKTTTKARPGRPKTVSSGLKSSVCESVTGSATPVLSWPAVAMSRKRPLDLFHFNSLSKRALRGREADLFPLPTASMSTPAKGIFSTPFEVDSFSSIANGYASFSSQQPTPGLALGHRSGRRSTDRREFLVKLDHEGVTSPKTKNGKALLRLGMQDSEGGRMEKGFGVKGIGAMASPMAYSQPVLLVKDTKRSAGHLLKGESELRKHPQGLGLTGYSEYGLNCHSECLSSYSDMDDEDEEEDARRAVLGTAGRFLSRLSVSSSSSGSSSSSSSGSLSSSSLCSSDNDSSYSSEDEEASQLLLQGCLSSHHTGLQQQQPPEPPVALSHQAFATKATAVTTSKGPANSGAGKPPRKKEASSISQPKGNKDVTRRQKMSSSESPPNSSPFLPARQLWRWSGNPTQRRGLKGKARKLFYKAIVRGKDTVRVGDCAVFLSAGRPHLPFIGRIESLWESWSSNMVVKVKWFYHPEETKLGKRHRDGKHALYQSCHEDENDVQTISHKCQVVSRAEYERLSRLRKPNNSGQDLYYLAGTYDPTSGQLVTAEGVSIIC